MLFFASILIVPIGLTGFFALLSLREAAVLRRGACQGLPWALKLSGFIWAAGYSYSVYLLIQYIHAISFALPAWTLWWPLGGLSLLALVSAIAFARIPARPNALYIASALRDEPPPVRQLTLSSFWLLLSALLYGYALNIASSFWDKGVLLEARGYWVWGSGGLTGMAALLSAGVGLRILWRGARSTYPAPPLAAYLKATWAFILIFLVTQAGFSLAYSLARGALLHGMTPLVFVLYLFVPACLVLLFSVRAIYALGRIRAVRREPQEPFEEVAQGKEALDLLLRIEAYHPAEALLTPVTPENLEARVRQLDSAKVEAIGRSRAGHPIFGYTLGTGPRGVSLIAGAHADEPVGPITALLLPALLKAQFPELLERYTFQVIPHINPDGAAKNAGWQVFPPDFKAFLKEAQRELPGEDVEFGFDPAPGCRPECAAAMAFLEGAMPCVAHFSLHSMPFAEGAWFLISKNHAAASRPLREALLTGCRFYNLPLHDIDRKGAKGFRRIAPGFATTPEAEAMRRFFLEAEDPDMAARFRPASMEWVQQHAPDALAMVSEIPIFLLSKGESSLSDPIFLRFRKAAESLPEADWAAQVEKLIADYGVTPVPLLLQVKLQAAMLLFALHYLETTASSEDAVS